MSSARPEFNIPISYIDTDFPYFRTTTIPIRTQPPHDPKKAYVVVATARELQEIHINEPTANELRRSVVYFKSDYGDGVRFYIKSNVRDFYGGYLRWSDVREVKERVGDE